jgi:hypothetical protein
MTAKNEQSARCDPAQLPCVETLEEIRSLSPSSHGLFVRRLDDAKLTAIAMHLPVLRHLMADGSTKVTDAGLESLAQLNRLECLDLEWSGVTDNGLLLIASAPSLRWIDIGFCEGVSSRGVAELRRLRPDLAVIDTAG